MVSEFSREVGGQQGDEARTNLDDVRNADPARTDRGSRPRRRPARRRGPRAVLLPQLLAAAVERDPAATAVVFGDRSLTYAELDAASSRTARLLIDRGIGPEDVVAVSLARSIESVLAVWSVAKSGAAFVPVDPNYPADRIEFMIADSGARLGLTRAAAVAALPETVEWIALDDPQTITDADALPSAPVSFDERVLPLRAENPAYVIYTSGSTGRPKGVPVTHTGLDDLAQEVAARFDLTPQSRVLHVASPSFDASVFEWLMTISVGATMVVAPPTVFGGDELAELLRRERVTHAVITPAVLTSIDPSTLTDLEMVLSAGEACPPDVVERWAPGRRFFNGYGPTESTIMTHCSGPLEPGRPVTIGTPVRNLSASVLDARLNPVAPGVAGELYVSGTALARGYRGRPGLTAERFVAGPGGTRLYRTGDLVRTSRGTNGELIYLGRNDFQVKIRGFRVELGEIDAALAACDGVDFAMTVGRETPAGQAQLVSYLHSSEGAGIDTRVVTEEISNALPSHMVPSVIVVLDEIPLTPSGKVDRAALPDPDPVTVEFRPPVTDTEIAVAEEFATLLGLERVGLDDDFFDLGGNSLVATRVAARLGERLDTRVPARLLFEGSTVAALAALIEPLGTGGRIPLTAGTRPETIPLSLAQQRMWFLSRFDTGSAANNIPVALRLRGALDVDALRAAIADLVDRHETLRTVYPDRDGVGSQVILPPSAATPTVRVEDVPVSEVENRVLRTVSAGFDVTTEVPLRLELLRVAPDEHVLVIVVHHIAADGASTEPFVRDLVTAYLARTAGAVPGWQPLAVQYADYTLWQRAVLGSEDDPDSPVAKEIAYWTSVLADLPDRLELPTDRPRPVEASGRGATVDFEIDPALHAAVAELGRAAGCSPFMVVHAAFAVLLSRISGARDIAIGTPVAGRGEQALDDLIGMFVNTLVLRTDITPDLSCAELLHRVRDTDIDAFAHADLPFERLVEILDPVRSAGHHPLFQVALFFQNMAQPELALRDLELVPVDLGGSIAKFDLQLTVTPREVDGRPAGIGAQFTYATDLFDDSTVRALAERLVSVLGAFASDADIPVGEIDLLTPHERHALTVGVNATDHPTDTGTLLSRYRAQVDRVPGATAVLFGDESLTYAEFDARVNRLARHLISSGVGPESLVALGIRRSIDLVVAMYAVVTAGGAYVPLDPDHPADRIGHILDTARPVCVLSTSADTGDLPEGIAPILLDTLETDGYDAHPVREDELRGTVQPASPAYVIFTSGSTGRPKGVSVPHEAIVNQLEWMAAEYDIAGSDVYLQKTATTFDVSLWGYFLPLRTGGTLVVAPHDAHRDPAWVADAVTRHRVTLTDFVPSMLTVFAAQAPAGSCASLRHVFVIGEALPPETVSAFRRLGDAALHNLYGPTEAAVSATYWPADGDGHAVPIGVPEWNVQVYVLDSGLAPTPVGTPGELYLGGVQLARGYEKRPDLSSDRFVASPLGRPGSRMYRTGDLVRWRRTAAGELVLDYLGRTDFQVKFRGQRIELGEIETALLGCAEVSQAVALVVPTSTGEQLVAYVVPAPGHTVDRAALLDAVKKTLPSYMVPSAVVALDEFPLNTSGKLDRKALPAPVFEAREFRAARTPIEEIVAGVYADVLGVARVGADDDFFELGGNSLVATRVASRISDALGTRVPVRELFESPTVAALAVRLESRGTGEDRPRLEARPRPERVPLSLAQQRMWFLNRFDPDSPAYNLPVALRITGSLDARALEAAVADVIDRHEILRTVYPESEDGPVQVVLPAAGAVPDLTPVEVVPGDLEAAVTALAVAGFDVTADAPLRARLFRLDADDHVLAFVVHHISADASSMAPLTRDLMTAYMSRLAGERPSWTPLPVQYADYSLWQREVLGSESDADSVAAAQIRYWVETLDGLPDQLELPIDRPRPPVQSLRGRRVPLRIPADVHSALSSLSRERGASLFMTFHAALAVLLSRLSASSDVAVGTPIAGRGEARLDDVIGMFVNTLVFRTRVDDDARFGELLDRVREIDLDAYANADLPFERIVEILNPTRSQARHPLFQVGLSFQNVERSSLELPGLTVTGLDIETEISQFDLHFIVADHYAEDGSPLGVGGFVTYATDLFDESTVVRFTELLETVLRAVTADPHVVVGDIDLLGEADRRRLAELDDTDRTTDGSATLVTLFDEQVARRPDAVALVSGDRHWTYAELDTEVNRLAHMLLERGVGTEDRVALLLPRCAELPIAMYAVAKTGAAYVPIDPAMPVARVEYILETSAPTVVLTNGDARRTCALDLPKIVDLDEIDTARYPSGPVLDAHRSSPLRPDDLAYVIFTSGSTGRPKGVAVGHRAVTNQLLWKAEEFDLGPDDVVLLKTASTFDLSVWEFWSAPTTGGRLVVARPDGHQDPDYLLATMQEQGVTVVHLVPSMLEMLMTASEGSLPESVRAVLAIGEALPATTARAFRRTHRAALFNLYGPTEAAVSVTSHEVDDADEHVVPIGTPEWNTRVHILDRRLHPVPAGVIGELYLAGIQLARGYQDRPALTADRFVADPFGPAGTRMYRTGDLAVLRTDGEIEYRGRSDFQVKIRGFRIELEEIESALRRLDDIAAAVVTAHHDARLGDRLVAYLVPAAGAVVDTGRVAEALARELPGYMIPGAFVVLTELPLTANGKLHRAALPAPVFESTEFRAPTTTIEQTVAGVFADVLGVDRIGLDDDFFDLGGNSLLATQVVARLGKTSGLRVPVRALFEAPGVGALAARLEQFSAVEHHEPLVPVIRPVEIPLSLAQQRMWFVNQFDTSSPAYNVAAAVRLSGSLDAEALQHAVNDVVARHETLRTRYPRGTEGPIQQILPAVEATVRLEPVDVTETDLPARVHDIVARGFDVTTEIPVRLALFRLAATEHVLVTVVHHISADGWSVGPLTRDLVVAYSARSTGAVPAWAALPIQYADFALWQRRMLGSEDDPASVLAGQAAYWKNALAGIADEIALPTDRPRPPVQSMRGGKVRFVVDPSTHHGLTEVARTHNATLFMVLHAALAGFLHRITGDVDIAIGTPVAGRGHEELDDLIGMFVNTLVLRTAPRGDRSFADLLAEARETDLDAFAHADIPFERLVEILAPERSTARQPLFQVALSFENLGRTGFDLPGLSFGIVDSDIDVAKFDLSLTLAEQFDQAGEPAGMAAEFSYARDLFDENTIDGFARRFVRFLDGVLTDTDRAIGDVDILDADERARLAGVRGAESVEPQTLSRLLSLAVAGGPDRTAVRCGDEALTYRELDEQTNRLARVLLDHGAGPETFVGLAFPRSIDMIRAVWAVAKTGAAYVPIDPDYPADRITYMLEDSGTRLGVTSSAHVGRLPDAEWLVLDDDEFRDRCDRMSSEPIEATELHGAIRVGNAAYVIYTSGSTGRPKGVVSTHAGLANLARAQCETFRITADARTLQFASPSFDASVLEMLLAVGAGATMVIVPPAIYGGEELAAVLRREAVTHAFVTPAALATVDPSGLGELEAVMVGGEAYSSDLVTRWGSDRRFYNVYGPTETTCITTSSEPLVPGGAMPIGHPLRGVGAHVLDARLHPVPLGVTGELYLSGPALTRGYHRRAGLTSERFVASPFGDGQRLYRTGDLVRWAAGGELEYVGRADQQVKIRGFRIELGEVDAAFVAHPDVDFAATLGHETAAGAVVLVTYVKPCEARTVDTDELLGFVAGSLPDYMVPTAVVVIDRVPLTPVGKLDKKALPEPVFASTERRAPSTPAETAIAGIFAEILGVDEIGADDSFFALGGDSIVSIQFVARARTLGFELSPRDVFERKTVAALAELVDAGAATEAGEAEADPAAEDTAPRTPEIARVRAGGHHGVTSVVIEMPGGVDDDGPAECLTAVLAAHPLLRLVVPREVDESPRVVAASALDISKVLRHQVIEGPLALEEIVDRVVREAADRLDPAAGIVVQFVRVSAGDSDLLVAVGDAVAVDGVSWQVLADDLAAAWTARAAGRTPTVAAEKVSARAWSNTFATPPAAPVTRVTTADSDERAPLGATVRHSASDTASVFADLAAAFRAEPIDVLVAVAAVAVTGTGGSTQVDLVVGADGRRLASAAGTSRTVGGLQVQYPARIDLDGVGELTGPEGAAPLVKAVKEQLRAALRRSPDDAVTAGPDTMVTLHGEPRAGDMREAWRLSAEYGIRPVFRTAPEHRLEIHASSVAGELTVTLTADPARVHEDELADVVRTWTATVDALARYAAQPGIGGLTPSDLPLVDADADDIEIWEQRYPGLEDVWPLTPLQQGMLFHALLASDGVDVYTTQFVLRLRGDLDTARLHRAAQTLLDRYPNLCAAFTTTRSGVPVQVVQRGIEVPWREVDVTEAGDPDAIDARIEQAKAEDLATHFVMDRAPLLRFTLFRAASDRVDLLVTSHHILIDGWSMPLLMRDMLVLYAADADPAVLPPVAPYRDYLEWLHARDHAESREAWKRSLDGLDGPTTITTLDTARGIEAGIGEAGFELTPDTTAKLSATARRLGVTLNTMVQTAWGLLLSRMTDRDDVVFGATVSGRPPQLPGIESMVGLFLNAVPVRVRIDPDETVANLASTVQREQGALLDHHYLGLAEIQESAGADALFDSLVVFESFPVDAAALSEARSGIGLDVAAVDAASGTHYPLTLMVVADDRVRVTVKYLEDVIGGTFARDVAGRLEVVLDAFAESVDRRIGQLDVSTGHDRARLDRWNATDVPELLDEATLVSLFEEQAARTPQVPAFVFEDTEWDYATFDAEANRLARHLVALGVGPETLVAVAMRRSLELPLAIYAIVKAGGGYVPIDPDHPADRTALVLDGARPACVLTTSRDGVDVATTVPVIDVDRLDLGHLPSHPLDDCERLGSLRPDNTAYVIYTSGSTGRPKGVQITHRQVANQFRWAQRTFPHSVGDVVLHKTPVTFDISTWELFWPLQTGATVVVARPDGHRDPQYLAETIRRRSVSSVHFVPSMLDVFCESADSGDLVSLKYVFAAGEELTADTVDAYRAIGTAALVNWYGPAEATVVTSVDTARVHGRPVPIGAPVANTTVHVLDSRLRPVPVGSVGELYVGGVQLSRGYAHAAVLTAERFVADPRNTGARLYRTGDLVRWREDGRLDYLGRSDFQVKLRGQRIELGEIEAVLVSRPEVARAVVTVVAGPDGGDRLAAYVVAAEGVSLDVGELAVHARHSLPSYMVPAVLVPLHELPLNANGKLDRKALPTPVIDTVAYTAPRTPLEELVAGVVEEVLGVEKVGVDDDFFALGGNSLNATQVASRLRDSVGADVRVQWLFTDPTVAALAGRISAERDAGEEFDPFADSAMQVLLPLRARGSRAPLFCVHPMYGLAWTYSGLTRFVHDRPIYGIQSKALSEDGYLPESLAGMAARYVEEIRTVQPHGPYNLMGWSLGGVLAHEMAVQLQAAGESVDCLAMLDSHLNLDVGDFRGAIRDELEQIGVVLDDSADVTSLSDEHLQRVMETVPQEMVTLTAERFRNLYESALRSAELIASHTPGVFEGDLMYFSAADHPPAQDGAAGRWSHLVTGTISDVPIDCVHGAMTTPESLAAIGPVLEEHLHREWM
ncbi:non-ribosomal peptide synthetase [Rhodococcus gordoniae]|uniref:Non-ribosomal peptide synthetase n=1 Tax=Rhodococcus gordoniae TaxID=223392 RepID=A0A379LY18_9NOCA|nr:non-ribosomal peptide synthetase [Rhodococcus gordoniae]